MFLSELNIWNFRKYGEYRRVGNQELTGSPGLSLEFDPLLNVLVGENDSGKTSIVDAIKLILLTQSRDYERITREDFHQINEEDEDSRAKFFRIQCIFRDLNTEEASHFLEWLGVEKNSDNEDTFFLKVTMTVKRKGNSIYPDMKAGPDDDGTQFMGEPRDYLRLTYLRPLRDAETELTPSRNSRLSQILDSHKSFREKEDHPVLGIAKDANKSIEYFFEGLEQSGQSTHSNQSGKELVEQINDYLERFFGGERAAKFSIADAHLKGILEKLSLKLAYNKAGLGSHNLLFIAAELLLLEREEYTGLKLALIEELEAHLHPQAQLRLIDYLQDITKSDSSKFQLILTSHSPNLASEIKLTNLIICHGNMVFPMGPKFTKLNKGDYLFLERFLDVTKANLFFAKGVIIVEGYAEALLVPVIADTIDCSLVKHGVSVVNVGSKAFTRYANVFKRKNSHGVKLDIPVSIITDADVVPIEGLSKYRNSIINGKGRDLEFEREKAEKRYSGQTVKTFVAKAWTLEYDLACSKLREDLYLALRYAIYIKNSDKYGLTEQKRENAQKKVSDDISKWEAKWKDDARKNEKIAFNIYNDIMLKKGQLKSITAQCLANIIGSKNGSEKENLREILETDDYLKYLIDAIKYATKR
ncbi:MAG: AAA family ATPase [Cyclobacteriaceae bacterium]